MTFVLTDVIYWYIKETERYTKVGVLELVLLHDELFHFFFGAHYICKSFPMYDVYLCMADVIIDSMFLQSFTLSSDY